MPRNDGRLEPGQRLNGAISARAWNRMLDAADIVLGSQLDLSAAAVTVLGLPCVKATLRDKGYFGEVRVFDEELSNSLPVAAVMPSNQYIGLGPASLSGETTIVKQAVAYSLPYTLRSSPLRYDRLKMESRFAICIGNDSMEYALSGLAITRVRVWKKEHRYARLPRPVDGYTGHDPDGCLDSAWWGPARIIGYAYDNSGAIEFSHSASMPDSTIVFRWALVHF